MFLYTTWKIHLLSPYSRPVLFLPVFIFLSFCLSPTGHIWDMVEECTFKTLPHSLHFRPGSLSLIYSLWFFLYFLLWKASLTLGVAKAGFCLPFLKKCLTQPLKNIYRLFLFSSVSLISTSSDHVFIDHLVNGWTGRIMFLSCTFCHCRPVLNPGSLTKDILIPNLKVKKKKILQIFIYSQYHKK